MDAMSHDVSSNAVQSKTIELWICRHGKTVANARGITQGQSGGTLDPTGIREAEVLGHALSKISFDRIYASDLSRVTQTMRPILTLANNSDRVPVIVDRRLRERDTGAMEGLTAVQRRVKTRELSKVSLRRQTLLGGECWEDVFGRAHSFFFSEIAPLLPLGSRGNRGGPMKILIVSHGGFIKEFLNVCFSPSHRLALLPRKPLSGARCTVARAENFGSSEETCTSFPDAGSSFASPISFFRKLWGGLSPSASGRSTSATSSDPDSPVSFSGPVPLCDPIGLDERGEAAGSVRLNRTQDVEPRRCSKRLYLENSVNNCSISVLSIGWRWAANGGVGDPAAPDQSCRGEGEWASPRPNRDETSLGEEGLEDPMNGTSEGTGTPRNGESFVDPDDQNPEQPSSPRDGGRCLKRFLERCSEIRESCCMCSEGSSGQHSHCTASHLVNVTYCWDGTSTNAHFFPPEALLRFPTARTDVASKPELFGLSLPPLKRVSPPAPPESVVPPVAGPCPLDPRRVESSECDWSDEDLGDVSVLFTLKAFNDTSHLQQRGAVAAAAAAIARREGRLPCTFSSRRSSTSLRSTGSFRSATSRGHSGRRRMRETPQQVEFRPTVLSASAKIKQP